jgi:hypothetical protein
MNLRVVPSVVVAEDTPVNAAVLNAGFRPSLITEGAVESVDLANGAVTADKLSPGVISSRAEEPPSANHWLWMEIGGQAKRVKWSAAATVWPWHLFPEAAHAQAQTASETGDEDRMLIRQGTELKVTVLKKVTLEDLITAGTYRVGAVMVDAKGRVTAVNAGAGTWSTDWHGIPPAKDFFRFTHSLGKRPALAQAWLRYVGSVGEEGGEGGYVTNQVVSANAWFTPSGAPAFQIQATETELKVWRVTASVRMLALGGSVIAPTPSKWQLMVNLRL